MIFNYYLVKVNVLDSILTKFQRFEFCNGHNHRTYEYKSTSFLEIEPGKEYTKYELRKLFNITNEEDTNSDESVCTLHCLDKNIDIIKSKIGKNRWIESGYSVHEKYYIHKILYHVPYFYYNSEYKADLVLAEVECEYCKKFILIIFTVGLAELIGQHNQDQMYGWSSHEFSLTAEGYLTALNTFLQMVKIPLINKWIAKGRETFGNRPRKPDYISRFGLLTEKIPLHDEWNDPLFKDQGVRHNDIPPHTLFDSLTKEKLIGNIK